MISALSGGGLSYVSAKRTRTAAIEEILGYTFKDTSLLHSAFTHSSFRNEALQKARRNIPPNNERLEFLGDSVLDIIVAEHLFQTHPRSKEGELTRLKSNLVDAPACTAYVKRLGLQKYLRTGGGPLLGIAKGDKMLADLFEAILGAIYLDGGLDAAKKFFLSHFTEDMHGAKDRSVDNPKGSLQTLCTRRYGQTPIYILVDEEGPAHRKIFSVEVWVGEQKIGEGEGRSKKEAEKEAALDAYHNLGKPPTTPSEMRESLQVRLLRHRISKLQVEEGDAQPH